MTPTHAPTPCVEPGCFHEATHKGRCAPCNLDKGGARVPYDKARGSARDRGYTAKWEKRRLRHLEIEPFCRQCGKPGQDVDHVIPHQDAKWLFDLEGNLQTLCKSHHSSKTGVERRIPIGMMYPIDLPEAPHYRPTRLICGPMVGYPEHPPIEGDVVNTAYHAQRNPLLRWGLKEETDTVLVLAIPAPRTAERAFWSYVMDCEAELLEAPKEWLVTGYPHEWWEDFLLDGRAEEAMAARGGRLDGIEESKA